MNPLPRPARTADPEQRPLWLKIPLWVRWAGVVLFNTLIALFLTSIDFGGSFLINWLFSQCIGLTIKACVELSLRLAPARPWRLPGLVLAVSLGAFLGTGIALMVTGVHRLDGAATRAFWQAVVIGLVAGAGMTLFAYYRERTLRSEQALDAAHLRQLSGEKARLEAELRMLQAQVEPHFLFNTLAILRGLISHDPVAGTALLDHLIDFLRASLSHSRSEGTTLGDELRLLDSYLTIMQIRMGERLSFSISVPPELSTQPMPPMLLQPLVENAIRHGLEPKTGACRLWIDAIDMGDDLMVEVIDNGTGFGSHTSPGNGLANLRARLEALYPGRAAITLQDNEHGGITASLRMPRI